MIRLTAHSHRRTSILSHLRHKHILHKPGERSQKYIWLGCIATVVFLFLFLLSELWNGWKHSLWDGNGQLTLAFEQNNNLGYIRFSPELHEVTVLTFPRHTMIDLSNGYQTYQADRVKMLAIQEKMNFGNLLKNSLTQYLGNVTDGYIVNITGDKVEVTSILIQALLKKAQTNLTDWDLLRLWFFYAGLRVEQTEIINVEESRIFKLVSLPDKREVLEADTGALDDFVLKELANPQFLREEFTWEVYNGTNHTGLGSMVSRMTSNSGFDVVGVRQAPQLYEQTYIAVKPELAGNISIKQYAHYFNIPVKVSNEGSERSDVTIIIGEDFWKTCCQR